jgi:hypothetical protein
VTAGVGVADFETRFWAGGFNDGAGAGGEVGFGFGFGKAGLASHVLFKSA